MLITLICCPLCFAAILVSGLGSIFRFTNSNLLFT